MKNIIDKLKNGSTKQVFLGFKDILNFSEEYFTHHNECNPTLIFEIENAK